MPDSRGPNEDEPLSDVLSAATVLLDLDAARAEAWASGLLAEVPDHDALLEGLRAAGGDAALAVAVALSPMLAGAADVARELSARGDARPAFAPYVGTALPVGAWAIVDPYGSGTSVVVEYEHGDGVRHDLLVEIDGTIAVDLLVSPPGVVEVAGGESERPLRVDELTAVDAYERIRRALVATSSDVDAPVTDAFLLNHALVASRVGAVDLPSPGGFEGMPLRAPRPEDPDGDAFALATLTSALGLRADGGGSELSGALRSQLAAVARDLRAAWHAGDAEVAALLAEIDVAAPDDVADEELLVRVAGAYIRPGPRAGLSPAAADAIDALEWADWLGAALPLVRGGAGADASPEQLVRNINRCPEVTTSIPKRDAPAVASAFGCALPAWRAAGATDDTDRLTELGAWLLPRALSAAWSPSRDSGGDEGGRHG